MSFSLPSIPKIPKLPRIPGQSVIIDLVSGRTVANLLKGKKTVSETVSETVGGTVEETVGGVGKGLGLGVGGFFESIGVSPKMVLIVGGVVGAVVLIILIK